MYADKVECITKQNKAIVEIKTVKMNKLVPLGATVLISIFIWLILDLNISELVFV